MNEFFDKEEWANRKQQDRESAYAMVDDALKKVGTDGKAFQTYLDVQSKFERYSVSNALLVAAQKPDATDLGEANFWRGREAISAKENPVFSLWNPEIPTPERMAPRVSASTSSVSLIFPRPHCLLFPNG